MKWFCALWLVLLSAKCFSQTFIDPYPLQVGVNKTTNLIFPYAVKRVNVGSPDVVGQIVNSADTILQIKAVKKDFPETNMSVVTADGRLHGFLISYSNDPKQLYISFRRDSLKGLSDNSKSPFVLNIKAPNILKQKHFLNHSVCDEQMVLTLQSIYIYQEVLWFSFDLRNYSLIDFKPGYIKFFIGDSRKAKRMAVQEIELIPLFQTNVTAVPGKDKRDLVLAFSQFALSKDKQMVVQISEQNGGRLLTLHINHRTLLKARAPLTLVVSQ